MTQEELLNEIISRGFDAFVNNDTLIITKDGYTTTSPLKNALALTNGTVVDGHEIVIPEDMAINIILDNHVTQKQLDDGTIGERKSVSLDDIKDDLEKDNFNKVIEDVINKNDNIHVPTMPIFKFHIDHIVTNLDDVGYEKGLVNVVNRIQLDNTNPLDDLIKYLKQGVPVAVYQTDGYYIFKDGDSYYSMVTIIKY